MWHEQIACCRLRRRARWSTALLPTRAGGTDDSCLAAQSALGGSAAQSAPLGSAARSAPLGSAARSAGHGSPVVRRRCQKTTSVKLRRLLSPLRVLAVLLLGRLRAHRGQPAREAAVGQMPTRGLRLQRGQHKQPWDPPRLPVSQHTWRRRSATAPSGSQSTAHN